jgi:NAD(P)-dependent dehydrogenase (short-subunit alcohol dehydrogenase family)
VLEVVDGTPVTEVALRFGVARQTVHRWVARYRESGLDGRADRSHAPRAHPWRLSAQIEAVICDLRAAHRSWGPTWPPCSASSALGLAPLSIRVNAVHPGNINTDMLRNDAMYKIFRPDLDQPGHDDAQAAFGSMHKLPVNTLDPVDISEAVLYLASDAARYVTGQQLKVEAGALLATTDSGAPA